jgi:hypothetical protein
LWLHIAVTTDIASCSCAVHVCFPGRISACTCVSWLFSEALDVAIAHVHKYMQTSAADSMSSISKNVVLGECTWNLHSLDEIWADRLCHHGQTQGPLPRKPSVANHAMQGHLIHDPIHSHGYNLYQIDLQRILSGCDIAWRTWPDWCASA